MKKSTVSLSERDLNIITKALDYLCIATHSRDEYLYSEKLCRKLKDIINNIEMENNMETENKPVMRKISNKLLRMRLETEIDSLKSSLDTAESLIIKLKYQEERDLSQIEATYEKLLDLIFECSLNQIALNALIQNIEIKE